jgi:hypothetical protein
MGGEGWFWYVAAIVGDVSLSGGCAGQKAVVRVGGLGVLGVKVQ